MFGGVIVRPLRLIFCDIFREGEDVVGCVSHDPGVGGDLGGGGGAEDPDHLLHLRRWQWGGCHGSRQESRVDLSGLVILITMTTI